jgi:hypothetical protein
LKNVHILIVFKIYKCWIPGQKGQTENELNQTKNQKKTELKPAKADSETQWDVWAWPKS